MTGWKPDAYDRQRQAEAGIIEAKCPQWAVIYGAWSRRFWAFGSPDEQPIVAKSASELLGLMRAAERSHDAPDYQQGPPYRR